MESYNKDISKTGWLIIQMESYNKDSSKAGWLITQKESYDKDSSKTRNFLKFEATKMLCISKWGRI